MQHTQTKAAFLHAISSLSGERKRAMEFLYHALPQSDLDSYPFSLFDDFAGHALMLREKAAWCRALDEELFFHYVLFPRINDEDLSPHRKLFFRELWPHVEGLGEEEAVLVVNRWCHEQASYQMQDARTASPLTVFRCGSGRCGEESAFLAAALRSVGIAARQVYAPRWAHCDDNHAWVEALCGGRWRFLGACEPEPRLDYGWFNAAAGRAVLVHSRLFSRGSHPLHGGPIEDTACTDGVFWYNQTARYAAVSPRTFRVTRRGKPVPGARLTLCLLNEAAFHPITHLTAGGDGTARIELGKGDLWIFAERDGMFAEGLLPLEQEELSLELQPEEERQGSEWMPFSFRAPAPGALPEPLGSAEKERRKKEQRRGEQLRQKKLNAFFDPVRAERYPQAEDLLREARGNFDEIFLFLSRDSCPWREKLLRALPVKDLRDAKADILEEHLQGALPFAERYPEAVFSQFLLSPRISREPLRAWRTVLAAAPLQTDTALTEENYTSLCWPPDCALLAGRCSRHSRDILTVALFRAHGIPARLRELDGTPEVWQEGGFIPLAPEAEGQLILRAPERLLPVFGCDCSLARWTEEGWQNLSPVGHWEDARCALQLSAGYYRLLSSVRLPSGEQRAARRDLKIAAGEKTEISLFLQNCPLHEQLYCRELPPIPAKNPGGISCLQTVPMKGAPSLLLWLEEGAEPTEHLLRELAAAGQPQGKVLLFLRTEESLRHPAIQEYLLSHPETDVFFDDWEYDVEQLARLLSCDPERPPLCLACSGQGQAVYAESGYRVGMAGLLLRILEEASR